MNSTVSPRHPFKAIAVVLAMFVVVHAARAHVDMHERAHGGTHIHIVHASPSDPECADIDIDEDDDEGPDDATVIDLIDDDADWT